MASQTVPLSVAVLIDHVSEAGGAETLAIELLLRLDPARFRRRLFTYRHTPSLRPEGRSRNRTVRRLRAQGIEVVQLDALSRLDVASWRPLLASLHRGGIDVLHTHKHGPNLWGGLLSRVAPPPVFIAHEHTWSFEDEALRIVTDRWIVATRASMVLAVSEADRRKMIEVEGIPADRVRVLLNGIPPVPLTAPDDLRAEFGIPVAAPLVGATGVLRPQKDFPSLVEAHRLVLQRHPDAHLVIVGAGVGRAGLERLVEEHGLQDRVHLAGFRPSGPALARQFDVAVNSSTFEGSSLAIIEYMATGRPIVATAVGGTGELLAGGDAGILIPPSQPDALAAGVSSLLDDPDRAAALGAAAAARQQQEFDVDRQVERLQDLYLELYSARLEPGRPPGTRAERPGAARSSVSARVRGAVRGAVR